VPRQRAGEMLNIDSNGAIFSEMLKSCVHLIINQTKKKLGNK